MVPTLPVAAGLCQAHACALGSRTDAARCLVPGAKGRFGQSSPSGSGVPDAAGKPVVSLGLFGIQGCPQFSWMTSSMAFFLLLGPSGAGCALQCTVGEAGLHCASQLGREVILIHLHPPPQHFLLLRTLFRIAPLRCSLQTPPHSISFIFLSHLGPGDRWGAEAKQVSGADRSYRGSG